MKKLLYNFFLIASLITFSRCEEFFDPNPDDVMSEDEYISDVNELYSGYMGIAAKVQSVGDQAIILAGLRGDLLVPTTNAPQELWDIYNHKADDENPYTNPMGYYDVIIHANDYIKQALEYKSENPKAIDDAIFEPLISGAIRYKCWAYLMLGKLYGKAVYFDDPLVDYADLSRYPTLELDQLIQQLLTLMQEGVEGINGQSVVAWSDILFPGVSQASQDLTWNMITPSPEPLLMELNLWAGNYQAVVDLAIPFIYDNGSKRYKISNEDYNGEWSQFFYRDPVTKTRGLINIIPYDYERNQTNRLISYFSNTYPSVYYLKPSEDIMERFRNQVRQDGITKGDRYRGENTTFIQQNGEWLFQKFTLGRESSDLIYKNNVHITLYRDADIHFFLIEALNQLGLFAEAEAFLNDGVEAYLSKYAGELQAPLDNEVYNSALIQNWGIRRRVDLAPVYPEGLDKEELDTPDKIEAYKKALDILVVEETSLESAGEARAYFAMIRIAKRWNDPAILADRVSAKYSGGMQSTIQNLLMNPENWFVPYNLRTEEGQ